jgi:uncharacterized protein YlxW (UPF0749 family)
MGAEMDLFEAAHRLARRYVRDGLSFWDALQEASRLDPAQGIERFKTSALYQLERALEAERAESRELRAEIKELERRLDPDAAESEAYEREMESRLARERERQAPLI